jgi:hypothetical protein
MVRDTTTTTTTTRCHSFFTINKITNIYPLLSSPNHQTTKPQQINLQQQQQQLSPTNISLLFWFEY